MIKTFYFQVYKLKFSKKGKKYIDISVYERRYINQSHWGVPILALRFDNKESQELPSIEQMEDMWKGTVKDQELLLTMLENLANKTDHKTTAYRFKLDSFNDDD